MMDHSDTNLNRGPIAWMAGHSVAANLLMVVLLVGGAIWAGQIKKEVFPDFELDMVNITVPYPGASPETVQSYITQPLKAYEQNPIWTADPKHTPYRDTVARMFDNGYAGKLGYASAAAMADFIVVNMVAEAASGAASPKEAMQKAEKRALRYYRV